MKGFITKSLIAMSIMTTSATALAYQDTSYFTIERLVMATGSSSGYRLYPAAGYTLPNQGCSDSDYAEMYDLEVTQRINGFLVVSTAPEATLMNNALLAAFLGGRKVKLRLDGCGPTGRPKYRIVTMSAGS